MSVRLRQVDICLAEAYVWGAIHLGQNIRTVAHHFADAGYHTHRIRFMSSFSARPHFLGLTTARLYDPQTAHGLAQPA